MRLVLDLQACQTASAKRGIGRYSLELGRALMARSGMDVHALLDGSRSEAGVEVERALAPVAPGGTWASYFHYVPPRAGGEDLSTHALLADLSYRRHVQGLGADALHVSSALEGFIEPVVPLLKPELLSPRILTSATLYDLIPLLFSEQYLSEPAVKAWYERRLVTLGQFDVLLAISESSRKDAVHLLGIDPTRITNISGGADLSFYCPAADPEEAHSVRKKFGIGERFVLYTGNGDFRKNLERTVRAFAELPEDTLQGCQLVLNQGDETGEVSELARKIGLKPSAVVCTGYIDDCDLRALYRACTLFVFPSLYEGFGLPVIEAMACGAPVMAADNSSLAEILPRSDALFDGSRTQDIAAAMARGLRDAEFRRQLAEYGRERAREFSWDRSAALASEALQEARTRKLRETRIAVPGRRIAFVSPLPPERSGISDYSADLLPALASTLDVDLFVCDEANPDPWLARGFAVYPWRTLEARAHHYAQIIYQFGNSPFHTHMFDLLERVPGTVVLHDVFLSDVIEHEDRNGTRPGWLGMALRHSHGRFDCPHPGEVAARREVRRNFPCSRSVIESANALLVHSKDAAALVRAWYPWNTGTPLFQVPAIRAPIENDTSGARRKAARARLGIPDGEFLICSFGYVSDTKRSDLIASAYARCRVAGGGRSRLVFVGEGAGGAWGTRFAELLDSMHVPVEVSGFVDRGTYSDYLDSCDVAVQLRSDSRGESSRAVLDALAHGVPTIINAYGFLAEIPDAVVCKLSSVPGVEELAEAIDVLAEDDGERQRLKRGGPSYIVSTHSPEVVAGAYARAIELCIQEPSYEQQQQEVVGLLADAFEQSANPEQELTRMAVAVLRSVPPRGPRRLLIDVSDIHQNDYRTGIHRVVRNLVRELCTGAAPAGVHAQPVRAEAGKWLAANGLIRRLGLDAPPEDREVSLDRNDVIVLLDSSWDNAAPRFDGLLDRAEELAVPICGVVYDLIPVRYPEMCVEAMPPIFAGWLSWMVSRATTIACISRATAQDLHAYIKECRLQHRPGLRIGHFPLGADLVESCAEDVRGLVDGVTANRKTFLAVGTVEPRKRYDLIIDAFEACWQAGEDIQLLVVGKPGWNADATINRLRTHPEAGLRLHWFESLGDEGLRAAYRSSYALVQASIAEGFGLPLVEAMHYGVHTIASDIPVFREVTGGRGTFFAANDRDALVLALRNPATSAADRPAEWPTWSESARQFAALVASPTSIALV